MKHNSNERRKSALERLKDSEFFDKKDRTKESWQKRVDHEIKVLEHRIQK